MSVINPRISRPFIPPMRGFFTPCNCCVMCCIEETTLSVLARLETLSFLAGWSEASQLAAARRTHCTR